MSNTEEIAKAVQETAKLGQTITNFVAKVLKEPLDEASGIIGDRLKFLRWQRQIRMMDKANKLLAERGIMETRAVPPKLAIPLLVSASLEEDNKLQDLWVKLLVNALDPNFKPRLRMAYLSIIRDLEPIDALILDALYDDCLLQPPVPVITEKKGLTFQEITLKLIVELSLIEESVENLLRLNCVEFELRDGHIKAVHSTIHVHQGEDTLRITLLGLKFVEACIK